MSNTATHFHPIKGLPPRAEQTTEQVHRQTALGKRLLHGDLSLPLAVLKHSALQHNLHWMSDFCAQRQVSLAPHGKTSMSPELWHMQLQAGAWGISFANVQQAAVGALHGVPVLLIANQVVQRADLDILAQLHANNPTLRSLFLVDAPAQVQAIDAWAKARGWSGRFDVLIEIGLTGHRTGVRTDAQARQLAQAIVGSAALRLVGLECYEGTVVHAHHDKDREHVSGLMQRLIGLAQEGLAQGWFADPEIVLSAGGSAVFDLVAEHLRPPLARPVRGVLRSGCYITHDHQRYARYLCCMGERLNLQETLKPALEVLACVQSQPEPGLAFLGLGKRDIAHDLDLPQTLWRADGHGGAPRPVPAHWRIDALNDQHTFLRFDPEAPAEQWPTLGETVACGMSHPCTTFDKWRWIPVVDDHYQVVDSVSTWF